MEKKTVLLRVPEDMLRDIDVRVATLNVRRAEKGDPPLSRHQWFLNVAQRGLGDAK